MMDDDVVQAKVDVIEHNLQALEEHGTAIDGFWDEQAVKFTLLEVVAATIDIANHVIASQGYDRPDSYREYFQILAEKDVIEAGLADRLGSMAGFRNILVHRYEDLDDERLESILETRLDDIEEFVAAVLSME